MDTDVDVLALGGERPSAAFAGVRLLFRQQEERLSRFLPASALSRLNRGEAVEDPFLAQACRLALDAYSFTGGLFNPMILPALVAAGYAVTLSETRGGSLQRRGVPSPLRCLEVAGARVSLRKGQIDLGGIAKGWTVDLAAALLAEAGVEAALVNAGGDLRCFGAEPGHDGWWAEVDGGGTPAWAGPIVGAMATSSVLGRRWRTEAGEAAHHLIDPRTGVPAAAAFSQATVRGGETWRAEAWAKAVIIGGPAAGEAAGRDGYSVLALGPSGVVWNSKNWC